MYRNPSQIKEEEWLRVSEEFRKQAQKPQDFFPKEEIEGLYFYNGVFMLDKYFYTTVKHGL